MSHRPELRAQAVAALLSGSTWRDVSAGFRVSQSTLARWLDDVQATPGKDEGARRRAVREAFKDQVGDALLPQLQRAGAAMNCPANVRGMSPQELRRMLARQEEGWQTLSRIIEAAQAIGIL